MKVGAVKDATVALTGHNFGKLHEKDNHGEENGHTECQLFARIGRQCEGEECH